MAETRRGQRASARSGGLTRMERDVLACLREGRSLADTAAYLGISVATVKRHRQNVRERFGGTGAGPAWLVWFLHNRRF